MFYRLKLLKLNLNHIFRYNWESKYLFSLFKKKYTNNSIKLHSKLLYNNIKILLQNNDFSILETNYIAVTFEALVSLKPFINKKYKIEILNYIFYLFYLLQQRISINGLYLFLNNIDARIDITCHILNGFFDLLSQK